MTRRALAVAVIFAALSGCAKAPFGVASSSVKPSELDETFSVASYSPQGYSVLSSGHLALELAIRSNKVKAVEIVKIVDGKRAVMNALNPGNPVATVRLSLIPQDGGYWLDAEKNLLKIGYENGFKANGEGGGSSMTWGPPEKNIFLGEPEDVVVGNIASEPVEDGKEVPLVRVKFIPKGLKTSHEVRIVAILRYQSKETNGVYMSLAQEWKP